MPTELQQKLADTAKAGMASWTMAFGRDLGLFEALGQVGSEAEPATPKQVADRAGCKERYVKEWLCAMGCYGFIQMTPDERFWLSDEQKHEYAGTNNSSFNIISLCPVLLRPYAELAEVFRKDGPYGLGYDKFASFYDRIGPVTQSLHSKHLIPDYVPLIGMKEKLEAGLTMIDVGCGSGFHAIEFAANFPNCKVYGADISEDAIQVSRTNAAAKGLTNIEFHVLDAGKMPVDWTAKFDFITIFDACHDQMRPDLCLKEVNRMLKADGAFAMLEMRGTSNAFEDRAERGDSVGLFYSISVFHCLPVGSNSKDALCLGNLWGERRAKELLKESGFSEENVKVLYPEYFPINLVYLCKKQ